MGDREIIAISATSVVAVGLAVSLWFALGPSFRSMGTNCSGNQIAGGSSAIGGPFTLVNENGATVSDQDVFTEPSLVYFGYTFCPDVCPLDNTRNADAAEMLENMGHQVQPVFISIDPNRDTPEVMREYTDYMHPRMLGLTGSKEQVKAASQAYRTYFQIPESDDEFYLVDHSTFTYLVMPGTGFTEYFSRETSAEEMAEITACYIAEAPSSLTN